MKNAALLLLMSCMLLSCTCRQHPVQTNLLSEADPESVGMSSARLARIDTMLREAISQQKIPGAVALVARHGRIVYYKAFGMADNQAGRLLRKDDIFRIASQTKAITATAVMMLWEEGKFRLDDPISMYIPEFKNPGVLKDFNPKDSSYTTVPAASEITIRELLTHTSGIGYGMIDGDDRFSKIFQKAGIIDAFTTADVKVAENIKKLGRMPLHFNPGERFSYSEGLDVLALLVELESGMPFDQFLRKRIFEPLGMTDTWFYLPAEKASRLVSVQHPENGKWVKFPKNIYYDPEYPVTGYKKYFAGGAGLSSTAKDYATFLQMYLNGGELNGKRLLSRTTVRTIMGNQNTKIWGEDAESYYGLAFSVTTRRGQDKGNGSEGTFSWGGYFNTSYFADPVEGLTGILMKQTQDTNNDDTGTKFSVLAGQAIND